MGSRYYMCTWSFILSVGVSGAILPNIGMECTTFVHVYKPLPERMLQIPLPWAECREHNWSCYAVCAWKLFVIPSNTQGYSIQCSTLISYVVYAELVFNYCQSKVMRGDYGMFRVGPRLAVRHCKQVLLGVYETLLFLEEEANLAQAAEGLELEDLIFLMCSWDYISR